MANWTGYDYWRKQRKQQMSYTYMQNIIIPLTSQSNIHFWPGQNLILIQQSQNIFSIVAEPEILNLWPRTCFSYFYN